MQSWETFQEGACMCAFKFPQVIVRDASVWLLGIEAGTQKFNGTSVFRQDNGKENANTFSYYNLNFTNLILTATSYGLKRIILDYKSIFRIILDIYIYVQEYPDIIKHQNLMWTVITPPFTFYPILALSITKDMFCKLWRFGWLVVGWFGLGFGVWGFVGFFESVLLDRECFSY